MPPKNKATNAQIKLKSEGWVPEQSDIDKILNRLEQTGQRGITHLDRDLYRNICAEYRKAYPDESVDSVSYKYFTLWKYLRIIFKNYRMEFFRWMSDPDWIFEADYAVDKFLDTGYLPEKFLAAAQAQQGGFFKWSPNATIELVEEPRGTGKTTKWSCMRAIWHVIKYPKHKGMVVSGDKDKAKALLKSVKDMMMAVWLEMIYPDLFTEDAQEFKSRKGNVFTAEKVDVVTFNDETEEILNGKMNYEFRKEATFMICSPQIDRTSFHFEFMIADDLVNKETSYSSEVTRQIVEFYRSLFAMQQYRKDWSFRCYMTGTEWWQDSLYTELESWNNVTIFRCPSRWRYGDMDVRFCPVFTDSFLENMRTVLGEWYDNQMDMKPRPYSGSILDVGFSHDRNVIEMTLEEFERLKADNMVAQICDPSYTAKNKKEGDKKSRFTILNTVVSEDHYYLYGGYQCLGLDIAGVKATNLEVGLRENIDFFIQDAQGSQQNYYKEQIAMMKKELPAMIDFEHKLRIRGDAGSGKQNAANSVLKDLMLTGDILVIKIIDDPDEDRKKMVKEIISQLTGLSGMDFVDCTVYMVADIDRYDDVYNARLNKRRKNNGRHTKLINLTGGHKKFGRLA